MNRKFCITSILASVVAFGSLIATHADALATSRAQIKQIVITEAMNSNVPPSLALAVAKVESDFNAKALSTVGARGVMQIMPKTAQSVFGIAKDELWNARLNIQLGIDYLAQLYEQYGGRWDLALSHYNGGTLRGKGRNTIAHSYTRKYVQMVLNWQRRYQEQSQIWMVAAKPKTDGWQPARTRPVQVAAAGTRADLDRPWRRSRVNRPYFRKGTPRVLARYDDESWSRVTDTKVINDDPWSTILERRLQNRHRLDDFTPRFKWQNG
jgi:hypothetical protein